MSGGGAVGKGPVVLTDVPCSAAWGILNDFPISNLFPYYPVRKVVHSVWEILVSKSLL